MSTSLSRILAIALLCSVAGNLPAADVPVSSLQFEPYAFETSGHGTVAAEVAFFEVPRRHADPHGTTIRLRVVRLPARHTSNGTPRPAPIVYLAGGPGGSGVGAARGSRWPVFDAMRAKADVLLLDQRGTGLSEPPPACPHRHTFDPNEAAEPPAYLAALQAIAARCAAFWRDQGIDLDVYNTIDSAHDVEALRQALGVERLSLWGTSYGTHLATAVLRYHGAHIERAVLMGMEGPDDTVKLPLAADRLLDRLGALVAADPGAAELDANVSGAVHRVLATLASAPVQGRVRRPFGSTVVTIGVFDAQLAITAALGRSDSVRLLPMALAAAERGDYDVLAEFVHAVREQIGTFNAMPLAMDIASGVSPARMRQVEEAERASLLGPALNFPLPQIGEGLDIADLGPAFRTPLRSSVPTLFISGTLDGRTPPANAEAAIAGFEHAHRLTLEGAGHDDDLWLSRPGIPTRIAAFFAGDTPADARLQAPPLAFATSVTEEILRAVWQRAGPAGLGLAALVLAGLTGVAWWWRRRCLSSRPVATA